MSLAKPSFSGSMPARATFGAGGGEPYARALRRDDQVLFLHDAAGRVDAVAMDLSRWSDHADLVDFSLLNGVDGAVLDIGCGPGRMVRAAMSLGHAALGIDVSPTAIEIAREDGLMVLTRSVFERLPREGAWAAALLVDGNIGIGGNPSALLARCAEIIAYDGCVIVEVNADPLRDHTYEGMLIDILGHASEQFPWAEIGRDALIRHAASVGLTEAQAWVTDDRNFVRLRRTPR